MVAQRGGGHAEPPHSVCPPPRPSVPRKDRHDPVRASLLRRGEMEGAAPGLRAPFLCGSHSRANRGVRRGSCPARSPFACCLRVNEGGGRNEGRACLCRAPFARRQVPKGQRGWGCPVRGKWGGLPFPPGPSLRENGGGGQRGSAHPFPRKQRRGCHPCADPAGRVCAWPHVCVCPLRANQGRGAAAPLPGWHAAYRSRVAFVREREWRRKGEGGANGWGRVQGGGWGARGNGGGGSCELSRHSTEGAKRRAHRNRGGAFCGHSQGRVTTRGALTFGTWQQRGGECASVPHLRAKGGGTARGNDGRRVGGKGVVCRRTSPMHRIRYTGRVVYALFASISVS
ncbi:hypothetical protein EDB85DRAFT_2178408 [Lactarius pseudohatsudake]|nr:hypothetical protein EDB85DRAFT_2178408 [Lactarius pseudohatsudake]